MNIQTDFETIKSKQKTAWASGDYAVVGTTVQIVGENLAETLDLAPGSEVLDVAAGNGNASLAFARRWHKVTSSDYVPTLLEKGRARAEAEGLNVAFEIADAEALPFPDESFGNVVSTFGVMFAPNQLAAAHEMLRVCKSGGSIGLANWTPGSFVGKLFKTIGKHVAPPAGVKSPALWGDEAWLTEAFTGAFKIEANPLHFAFRYRDPMHFVDTFRTFYGPVHKAFLALDKEGQTALERDILDLVEAMNSATDGTVRVESEYLEVKITK